ncbi:MAG: zinc finger Ran-binding domain-containing protein [archaeon]|nr:zinc finger Ran-binding domain-containing protein [archaeon]
MKEEQKIEKENKNYGYEDIFVENQNNLQKEEEYFTNEEDNKFKIKRKESIEDNDSDTNNKDPLSLLLPSDLCNQLNSDNIKDEITLENNNFYLDENNREDSENEDMILAKEEDSFNGNKVYYPKDKRSANNLISSRCPLEENSSEEYNCHGDQTLLNIKKQMNINQTKIPKVPSYSFPLNNLAKNYSNLFSGNPNISPMAENKMNPSSPVLNSITNEENNSFNPHFNYSTNNIRAFNFPNNCFSMGGRSGWVCPSCKNFNYEMRTKCNRCGKAQTFYQNNAFNSHGNLRQMEIPGMMQMNNFYNNKGSQMDLNNPYSNMNFPTCAQSPVLSPIKGFNNPGMRPSFEDKKKKKPFIEREGDWICSRCKNLNFAFRTCCNRCRYPKEEYLMNYMGKTGFEDNFN